MWIRVRSADGKKIVRIVISKLAKIEELRKLLVKEFNVSVDQQRLFYRGKQLEDGHSLFDYDVQLNDIIQIFIRHSDVNESEARTTEPGCIEGKNSQEIKEGSSEKLADVVECAENDGDNVEESVDSKYFKIGDLIDAKDLVYNAWFEAKVVGIRKQTESNTVNDSVSTEQNGNDGLLYRVVYEDYEDCEEPVELTLENIRPRARHYVQFGTVNEGDVIMVNYNFEEPGNRGFWYDCKITRKKVKGSTQELAGSIFLGSDEAQVDNCKIKYLDEMFTIEKIKPLSERENCDSEPVHRTKEPTCKHCKDIPTRKCKVCSCHMCGGKDQPDKQIICDECDLPFHIWCLKPPLADIPDEDEWYCPECKNDETEVVRAGEKLKVSKKKLKMASANSSSSRDWGKGMACVGRTKECRIVPSNHFGPIPGVEVGTQWLYRIQVSESGVHRPHVAGIHGRENEGAYSIVLSGGYEDDVDDGVEFKYTGSGGRDLSGNKRCAEQSCDQKFTRMNKALASNCNAPLSKNGAESKNWKDGKPIRVVRNFKGRKHSKYCPKEGNRYDGIYKVVKYWPEKGKSGFLVYRYLLRRDDPAPAPWTKAGMQRIQDLSLTMQYPEGFVPEDNSNSSAAGASEKGPKKARKRKHSDGAKNSSEPKKQPAFSLTKETEKIIQEDTANKKIWDECLECTHVGSQVFLKKVEDNFLCVCCQELVFRPITTQCSHNVCKTCLERSFKAKVFSCPMCRQDLEAGCIKKINGKLQDILLSLFPGYSAGR